MQQHNKKLILAGYNKTEPTLHAQQGKFIFLKTKNPPSCMV